MFAAFTHAKVLLAVATATTGVALGSQTAKADHFRGHFGVNVVLAEPVCPAPVVVAPALCPPPVVYTPAPVYAPAPVVVYTVPAYAPAPYVVVDRYPHYRFAPIFSFHGGWHR